MKLDEKYPPEAEDPIDADEEIEERKLPVKPKKKTPKKNKPGVIRASSS